MEASNEQKTVSIHMPALSHHTHFY